MCGMALATWAFGRMMFRSCASLEHTEAHRNREVGMVAAALTIGLAAFAVVFLFSKRKKDDSE